MSPKRAWGRAPFLNPQPGAAVLEAIAGPRHLPLESNTIIRVQGRRKPGDNVMTTSRRAWAAYGGGGLLLLVALLAGLFAPKGPGIGANVQPGWFVPDVHIDAKSQHEPDPSEAGLPPVDGGGPDPGGPGSTQEPHMSPVTPSTNERVPGGPGSGLKIGASVSAAADLRVAPKS